MNEEIIKTLIGKKIVDIVIEEQQYELELYILCENDMLIQIECSTAYEIYNVSVYNKDDKLYKAYYNRYIKLKNNK